MIEEGLVKSGRNRDEFDFGCRFGPFDNPRDYVKEIEAFSNEGLNCYQLGVNVKKHSEKVLRVFGDSVIATF